MSKVAAYLRGHISGEVCTRDDVRSALASDGGVLEIKPEMVIYPRTTNDIRKIARFAWQLSEKGHVLPLTIRGAGTDPTGAAIGRGVSIVTTAHMNKLFEYDPKQKLIRLQPGATISSLESALSLNTTSVSALSGSFVYGTVGGAVASAASGRFAGKYGSVLGAVDQLEVVLANGDLIQTGRISKKELNHRKGVQGFEGDLYRGVDGIIDEYADVIDALNPGDLTGYNSIADVKRSDGSFDLTPLFVGSQGTLGFISEMILRADFRSIHTGVAALAFDSAETARDALDTLTRFDPTFLEYFDAELFQTAAKAGKTYAFFTEASESFDPASVILVGFDDFNSRHREKHLKKIVKQFGSTSETAVFTADGEAAEEILSALEVDYFTRLPDSSSVSSPLLLQGFSVPRARLEDFCHSLTDLAAKEHVSLPLAGHATTNTYTLYPSLSLHKVSDKQKVFKLIDEVTRLVVAHGGTMIAEGGEGRIKTRAVYADLDEKVLEMYADIRKVFDPHGTLNPGVKQPADLKSLAGSLATTHDAGSLARFGLL